MTAPAAPLVMSAGQREVLEKVARSQTAAHREVRRARVLLDAANGIPNSVIATNHDVTPVTVRAWRTAFAEQGLSGWGKVAPGRGRKPSIPADRVALIVALTTTSKPEGHTHWSCRTMADRVGVSPATVQRIWSELGLQPHRVDNFKVSNDAHFEDKLIDVVGLYLDPPSRAVVLCMDEKSQIQALDPILIT